MADNPLSSLIQLVLLLFVIWSILVAMFAVITKNKHLANLNKENTELRAKLARYEQPVPDWVKQLEWRLFDDQPSDPAISALN